jgi:hypothetical protein
MKGRRFGWWLSLALVALFVAGSLVMTSQDVQPVHAQTVCPPGYTLTVYGCVYTGTGTGGCPTGYVLTTGGCLPVNGATGCPFGWTPVNGGCVPINGTAGCPAGYTYINGSCYPSTSTGCPAGYVYVNGSCLPSSSTCPTGYYYSNGACLPSSTTCPSGYYYSNGACLPSTTSVSTPLSVGCDQVIPPGATLGPQPVANVVALVQPSNILVSVWQFNNALHIMQSLYFNTPGAPVDNTTVAANQGVFLCVSANGTFGG